MLDMHDLVAQIALSVCLVGAILAAGLVYDLTGPNCPGADPDWIGWCSEAPALE